MYIDFGNWNIQHGISTFLFLLHSTTTNQINTKKNINEMKLTIEINGLCDISRNTPSPQKHPPPRAHLWGQLISVKFLP